MILLVPALANSWSLSVRWLQNSITWRPEYICIVKLLYTASLPELLAQFLATVTQERWSKPAPAPARVHPDLLHKPILTACPCLNRPTRASVLLGYTDSVTSEVLILLPL